MKKLYFEDYEDLTCSICDDYDEVKYLDDLDSIVIIARYYDAKEILSNLICLGYSIESIDCFMSPKYNDEFVISLFKNKIWCEPAKSNGAYKIIEGNICYIFEDCNSKILNKIRSEETYEVCIDSDCCDICDDECDQCELLEDDSDSDNEDEIEETSDTSNNKSVIYFHDDILSIEGISNFLKLFGIKLITD